MNEIYLLCTLLKQGRCVCLVEHLLLATSASSSPSFPTSTAPPPCSAALTTPLSIYKRLRAIHSHSDNRAFLSSLTQNSRFHINPANMVLFSHSSTPPSQRRPRPTPFQTAVPASTGPTLPYPSPVTLQSTRLWVSSWRAVHCRLRCWWGFFCSGDLDLMDRGNGPSGV